jgi:hypothetical protein
VLGVIGFAVFHVSSPGPPSMAEPAYPAPPAPPAAVAPVAVSEEPEPPAETPSPPPEPEPVSVRGEPGRAERAARNVEGRHEQEPARPPTDGRRPSIGSAAQPPSGRTEREACLAACQERFDESCRRASTGSCFAEHVRCTQGCLR